MHPTKTSCAVSLLLVLALAFSVYAQQPETNYDESKVPQYTLPDPLELCDGQRVTDARTWLQRRRPEVLRLFEQHVYGKAPGRPEGMKFQVRSVAKDALGGKAMRKEVAVLFSGDPEGPKMDILIYLPNAAKRPVPIFLGLNFAGNHAIHKDPAITLSTSWMRDRPQSGVENHRATEKSRGASSSRWAVEKILDRGYGLATIYYGDIDPDFDDGFQNGVHPLFYKPGQTKPEPEEWGSIGAWAWGLSRIMDYLEADDDIDHTRVAVSRRTRIKRK